jgi:putative DNA primase/helicase
MKSPAGVSSSAARSSGLGHARSVAARIGSASTRRSKLWHCRGCNKGGDVIALVEHLDSCDFATAVHILAGIDPVLSAPRPDPAKVAEAQAKAARAKVDAIADAAERFMRALLIWSKATPIENTLAERYLRVHRKLDIPDGVSGRVLRFHPECPFGAATHPCLVAQVRNIATDEMQAIVRTALNPDGSALKVDGKTARKALGSIGGGAIKVSDDIATGLTIGEGLETVLAGMAPPLWFRPAWALIDSANIARFPVLAGIESLTILVDNDRPDRHGRRAGQAATIECTQRWETARREVIPIISRVEGTDIADVAAARTQSAAPVIRIRHHRRRLPQHESQRSATDFMLTCRSPQPA